MRYRCVISKNQLTEKGKYFRYSMEDQAKIIRDLVEEAGLINVHQDPNNLDVVFITREKPKNPILLGLKFAIQEMS